MNVDDHAQGGKLTKGDGDTKNRVGDDWKEVVRSTGRQGASPGVKNKQQQMSFSTARQNTSTATTSPNMFDALVDEEDVFINSPTINDAKMQ